MQPPTHSVYKQTNILYVSFSFLCHTHTHTNTHTLDNLLLELNLNFFIAFLKNNLFMLVEIQCVQ